MFNRKMIYAPNYLCRNTELKTIKDIKESGFEIIRVKVPGCLELDLMREGKISDLYYSTNTLEAQRLENMHIWYFSKFNVKNPNSHLHFEGIDTFSEIYINGVFAGKIDNMPIPHDIYTDFKTGKNEVVVHILSTYTGIRKYELPAACFALRYGYAPLNARKAAHMFGWDIMPRIVSAGIWKPVSLRRLKRDRIKNVYFTTCSIDEKNSRATLRF